MEDNQSTIQIIKTGRNPTMRHMSRTHGVNVSWLHDLYDKKQFSIKYTRTDAQSADIFTKAFKDAEKWNQALENIGLGDFEGPAGKTVKVPAFDRPEESKPGKPAPGGGDPAWAGAVATTRRQRRAVKRAGGSVDV